MEGLLVVVGLSLIGVEDAVLDGILRVVKGFHVVGFIPTGNFVIRQDASSVCAGSGVAAITGLTNTVRLTAIRACHSKRATVEAESHNHLFRANVVTPE